jgi:phosphomannomutase
MKKLSEYKHLFFDLDDTLTASRTRVDVDSAALYARLPVTLIAVSGAESKQIQAQLGDLPFYHLGQNGNHARTPGAETIWERTLSTEDKNEILLHASKILAHADWSVADSHDLIEDRGSQIGFSLIGHHEALEKKREFDPHSHRRVSLLERIPFKSDHIEVKIGGTTCFDYFKKGHHKGSNVRALIEHMGWDPAECVYFGDKLHPGGNDEAVIGVIDTIAVTSHRDTYDKLKEAFG